MTAAAAGRLLFAVWQAKPKQTEPWHGSRQLVGQQSSSSQQRVVCLLAPKVAVCPSGDFLGSQRIQENRQHGSQKNTGSNSNKHQQITTHGRKKLEKKTKNNIYFVFIVWRFNFIFPQPLAKNSC